MQPRRVSVTAKCSPLSASVDLLAELSQFAASSAVVNTAAGLQLPLGGSGGGD